MVTQLPLYAKKDKALMRTITCQIKSQSNVMLTEDLLNFLTLVKVSKQEIVFVGKCDHITTSPIPQEERERFGAIWRPMEDTSLFIY